MLVKRTLAMSCKVGAFVRVTWVGVLPIPSETAPPSLSRSTAPQIDLLVLQDYRDEVKT